LVRRRWGRLGVGAQHPKCNPAENRQGGPAIS
jgi:hypothetical protein